MMWTRVIIGTLTIIVCMLGMYKQGHDCGFAKGIEAGCSNILYDFLHGNIRIEGDRIKLSDDTIMGVFDEHGKRVKEIKKSDIRFV